MEKHHQLTSVELLSNDRRAIGLGSSQRGLREDSIVGLEQGRVECVGEGVGPACGVRRMRWEGVDERESNCQKCP